MKLILAIAFVFLLLPGYCQFTSTQMRSKLKEARANMNGKMTKYDPKKAFDIFQECADQGNAEALNALGLHYKTGSIVNQDLQKARSYFQQAANKGYSKAFYNLGLTFKNAEGADQDFVKAYSYFQQAAESGDPSGWYAQGYMLYKGFGCSQSYSKAVKLFRSGAELGRPSCMYFLGLCYRNGYGVKQHSDSADFWLQKSALKGYQFAGDELITETAENTGLPLKFLDSAKLLQEQVFPKSTISKFKKIEPSIKLSDVGGFYQGYVIQYDWSGETILNVQKVTFSITSNNNNELEGVWQEAENIIADVKANWSPNGLEFINTQIKKPDHYNRNDNSLIAFKEAKLQQLQKSDSVFLLGTLSLHSIVRNEPEKPSYAILYKISKSSYDSAEYKHVTALANKIRVFPNPFRETFNIEFKAEEDGIVSIQLFSIDGKQVYSTSPELLTKGYYNVPVSVTVKPGNYIVKVIQNKKIKSTQIIKL
jgi:hypothetical protein